MRKSGVEQWDPDQMTLLTEGAKFERLAGELKVEGSVIGGRIGQQQSGGSDLEPAAADGDFVGSVTVGEESEVANADEAGGKDVEQKAPQELDDREGQDLGRSPVTIVFPGKGEAVVFDFQ